MESPTLLFSVCIVLWSLFAPFLEYDMSLRLVTEKALLVDSAFYVVKLWHVLRSASLPVLIFNIFESVPTSSTLNLKLPNFGIYPCCTCFFPITDKGVFHTKFMIPLVTFNEGGNCLASSRDDLFLIFELGRAQPSLHALRHLPWTINEDLQIAVGKPSLNR